MHESDYPVFAFPKILREVIWEVSSKKGAPLPLIAASALSAAALACQGRILVQRPNLGPTPVSLFLLVIAESGERKSAVDGHFFGAIREVEKKLHAQYLREQKNFDRDMRVWDVSRKALSRMLDKAIRDDCSTIEIQKRLELVLDGKPVATGNPVIFYKDVTSEALAYGLHRGWKSACLHADEGSQVLLGRASVNLGLLNGLWDGAPQNVSRRSTESFELFDASLTSSLQIQEGPFRQFMARNNGLAMNCGYLARNLISMPFSKQGTRAWTYDTEASSESNTRYDKRIQEVMLGTGEFHTLTDTRRTVINFGSVARHLWIRFSQNVENQLGQTGDFSDVRAFASKVGEQVARIAAVFHHISGLDGEISSETIDQAIRVGEWYLFEYQRLLGARGVLNGYVDVINLVQWVGARVHRNYGQPVRKSDIYKFGPNKTRRKAALEHAMSMALNDGLLHAFESKEGVMVGLGQAPLYLPQVSGVQPLGIRQ